MRPPSIRLIPLTQGKYAIVDPEDYELVSQFRWTAQNNNGYGWYARRSTHKYPAEHMLLHRFLMNPPTDKVIDHINGNGLDNRRINLRVCTQGENNYNSRDTTSRSRFKGVTWHKHTGKWQARISFGCRQTYLGIFATEEEAYAAYCAASAKYHGEFGRIT